MNIKKWKKLKKLAKDAGKKEALDYMTLVLKNKNFWGRLQVAWRILRCRI
jgi:hypothetical protein